MTAIAAIANGITEDKIIVDPDCPDDQMYGQYVPVDSLTSFEHTRAWMDGIQGLNLQREREHLQKIKEEARQEHERAMAEIVRMTAPDTPLRRSVVQYVSTGWQEEQVKPEHVEPKDTLEQVQPRARRVRVAA